MVLFSLGSHSLPCGVPQLHAWVVIPASQLVPMALNLLQVPPLQQMLVLNNLSSLLLVSLALRRLRLLVLFSLAFRRLCLLAGATAASGNSASVTLDRQRVSKWLAGENRPAWMETSDHGARRYQSCVWIPCRTAVA